MGLTKAEIADLVIELETGGGATSQSKYHPKAIYKVCDIVLGQVIEESLYKDRQSNNYEINGDFLSRYTAEVKTDELTGEKYSDLPAQIISLKNDRGLHQITGVDTDQKDPFVPLGNGGVGIFGALEAYDHTSLPKYYLENNRIVYRNIGSVEKVLVKMVASISDLDNDQLIPMPANLQKTFLDLVRDELKKMPPQDKTNDSNPNT